MRCDELQGFVWNFSRMWILMTQRNNECVREAALWAAGTFCTACCCLVVKTTSAIHPLTAYWWCFPPLLSLLHSTNTNIPHSLKPLSSSTTTSPHSLTSSHLPHSSYFSISSSSTPPPFLVVCFALPACSSSSSFLHLTAPPPRLLEHQLQTQRRGHDNEVEALRGELQNVKEENNRQQQLLAQNLQLPPEARIEASLQHEITRLTNENLVRCDAHTQIRAGWGRVTLTSVYLNSLSHRDFLHSLQAGTVRPHGPWNV